MFHITQPHSTSRTIPHPPGYSTPHPHSTSQRISHHNIFYIALHHHILILHHTTSNIRTFCIIFRIWHTTIGTAHSPSAPYTVITPYFTSHNSYQIVRPPFHITPTFHLAPRHAHHHISNIIAHHIPNHTTVTSHTAFQPFRITPLSNMASNHSTSLGIAQLAEFPTSTWHHHVPHARTTPLFHVTSHHHVPQHLIWHCMTSHVASHHIAHILHCTLFHITASHMGMNRAQHPTSGPALQNINITPQFRTTLSTSRRMI